MRRTSLVVMWVLLVAACATAPTTRTPPTERREDPLNPAKPMLIVAHRGASGLVEHGNTVAAFEKAIEVGAPMMELDVRRTRDGQLVVHHDPDVDEVPLHAMSYLELVDRTRRHGYRPPLLQEVVDLAAGRIALDVELKECGYEADVLEVVRRRLEPGDFVMKSFEDECVANAKRLAPNVRIGLLLGKKDLAPHQRLAELFPEPRLLSTRADFVSPHHRLLEVGFVRRMHGIGKEVWVWTVNEEADMRRLAEMGVDAVITDRPDLGVALSP